jgi:hypothetical protein
MSGPHMSFGGHSWCRLEPITQSDIILHQIVRRTLRPMLANLLQCTINLRSKMNIRLRFLAAYGDGPHRNMWAARENCLLNRY